MRIDAIDPAEKVVITFDFTAGLEGAETLSGVPTVSVELLMGADPAPNSVLNGAASVQPGNKIVLVPVKGGLEDCDYMVKVVSSTTNAAKVLALAAHLPVRVTP